MKKFSFAQNLLVTFLSKGLALFSGFIVSILYARLLGAEGKGIITALMVFPQLIVTIGRMGLKRSIALSIGKKLYKETEIYSASFLIWIGTSTVSMLVVALYYFNFLSDDYPHILFYIFILMIPFQYFENYVEGFFEGNYEIVGINVLRNAERMAEIVALVTLVGFFSLGITGAAITKVFIYIVTSFIGIIYLKKLYNHFALDVNKEAFKFLIKEGMKYSIPFFLITIIYKVDILILERMVSSSAVGIYSVGVAVAQLIWQVPTAINVVLYSATLKTKKSEDAVKRTTRLLRILTPFLILGGLTLFVVADLFVAILYGQEFLEAGSIIRILLPGIMVVVYSKIIHADVQGQGDPLFVVKPFIVAVITNIVLNLILIPIYSIQGAALASTISYVLETLIITVMYHKKYNLKYSSMILLNREDRDILKAALNTLKNKMRKTK